MLGADWRSLLVLLESLVLAPRAPTGLERTRAERVKIDAMSGNNMTYLSYITKYIKEENPFVVDISFISANFKSISCKYYTTHQNRCFPQAADIQVDIETFLKLEST